MINKVIFSVFFTILSLCVLPGGAAPKPLEIWVNSPTDAKYYHNMIKMYRERIDKNFQANVRAYGFTEMPDKLSVAIKTGINAPDIVQIDELFFSVFLGRELPFLDLTQRAREAGLTTNILPQRLGLFSYQDKIYGLPQSVAAVVLYYRQDLFNMNGITPADFRTWSQFMETSKKIKNQALLGLDWSYFEILLRQRGFNLFDKNGKPTFDSPVALETLEFLVNLADKGVGLNPDRGNIFDPTFFAGDVANNEVLAIIGAGWYGLDMLRNFTPPDIQGEWRAMPLPIWDDAKSKSKRPTSTFAGQGLLIYKKSKQTDLAWDFIKFVVGDIDANVERFLQGNCFPAFIPAWADLRMSRADTVFGGQSIGSMFMDLANQVPEVNQVPMRAMFTNLFRENYWSSIISGTIKPAAALAEIKEEIRKAAKR